MLLQKAKHSDKVKLQLGQRNIIARRLVFGFWCPKD